MSNRDRLLLIIRAASALLAFFYTTISSSRDRIREAEQAVQKYEAAVKKINLEAERNAAVSAGGNTPVTPLSITDTADRILSQLKESGITPERYQITGNGKNTQLVEFIFACRPEEFIRFLALTERTGTRGYTVTDTSVKRERNGGVSVILHAAATPCRVAGSEKTEKESPYTLVRLFAEKKQQGTAAAHEAVPVSIPLQRTADFKIIGTVSGPDGVQYVYVKNTGTNKLYKLPPDKIKENSQDRYVLVIDGAEFEIRKK